MDDPTRHDALVSTEAAIFVQWQLDLELADAAREAGLPHVVVCTDTHTGEFTLDGPYPDGQAATIAAERESGLDPRGCLGLRFSVRPIYPPGLPA